MKSELECLTCILRQGISTIRLTNSATDRQLKAARAILEYLHSIEDLSVSPAELSTPVYRIVKQITGNDDPYYELKKESTRQVQNHLEELEKIIRESTRPLWTAAHLAVIGNTIDFGIFKAEDIDIERDLITMLRQPLAIDEFSVFQDMLSSKTEVLYICDNAGEIYFDLLFSREIARSNPDLKVYFVVRSKAVINDATMEEALEAGLDIVGTVLTTGNDEIGLPLTKVNPEIQRIWQRNPLIISKGQGNFETLNSYKGDIFFLLKAKCPIVSRELGVKVYDAVFKYQH